MSRLQIAVVGLTVLLNALDGFDVLSISFASPGIMREWGINRAALGIVLSMELIGMAIGSIFLGGVADKIGRRPTVLGCLVVMAGGMYAATTATDVYTLSAWRRHARRHQRGGGRIFERAPASPEHLAHGDRLPAGRRLWRHGRA